MPRRQGHQQRRPVPAGREHAPARVGHRVALDIVHPHGARGPDDLGDERPRQRHPPVAPEGERQAARRHVHDLELAPLGVEQGDGDRVERDEPGRALGERAEDLVERVARGEQLRELVEDRRAERPPVNVPDEIDRGAELLREARGECLGREPPEPAEQEERPRRTARGAERGRQERRGAAARRARWPDAREPHPAPTRGGRGDEPLAELGGKPPPALDDDDRRAARRAEGERTGVRARQAHQARERLGQRLRDRVRGRERRQEIGKDPPDLHGGVRSLPGRLPVCWPSLTTKRPLTTTCSIPTG